MAHQEDLLGANDRFYRALGDLDLEAMDGLWVHEGWVRCVHPGSEMLVGWPMVRQSFEQIFASTRWIRVIPTNVAVETFGDFGIITCSENITNKEEHGVGVTMAQATNLFRITGGGWRMMHHHASSAPVVNVTHAFDGTVQ